MVDALNDTDTTIDITVTPAIGTVTISDTVTVLAKYAKVA